MARRSRLRLGPARREMVNISALKLSHSPDARSRPEYVHRVGIIGQPVAKFREMVRPGAASACCAEEDRYILYIHYGCPWAHRATIIRSLKGLEDVVQLAVLDSFHPQKGWYFTGAHGPQADPVYGVKSLRQLYEMAEPGFNGRVALPTLWDRKRGTIVSNDSGDILRMLSTSFDALLPEDKRESTKGAAGLYPPHLRRQIDELNTWVYAEINNGVYKTGFSSSQEAYERNLHHLFGALDRLEAHLSVPEHQPYLFGKFVTEADIRLFPTIIRFDMAYHNLFKCNMKMIRLDYPNIHKWVRRLYWDESAMTNGGAFKTTTYFDEIKTAYARASGNEIVPVGPHPNIMPLSF